MNDKILLERIKENDKDAFKILMDKYSKRLFYVVFRFVNNYDDTEDIMQEIWLKFYHNIDKFKNESSIYTFIYRIAVNLSVNFVTRKKLFSKIKSLLIYKFKLKKADDPIEKVVNDEIFEILKCGIDNLPKKQRKIFILRNQENLDFEKIADILKISKNSAKVNYHYALRNLKSFLIKKGVEL